MTIFMYNNNNNNNNNNYYYYYYYYIRTGMVTCEELMKKEYVEKCWKCACLEEEERKTLKFVDAGGNKWNEREGNWQYGIDWEGRMGKENKIKSVGKERCDNIVILYINKIIIILLSLLKAVNYIFIEY